MHGDTAPINQQPGNMIAITRTVRNNLLCLPASITNEVSDTIRHTRTVNYLARGHRNAEAIASAISLVFVLPLLQIALGVMTSWRIPQESIHYLAHWNVCAFGYATIHARRLKLTTQ